MPAANNGSHRELRKGKVHASIVVCMSRRRHVAGPVLTPAASASNPKTATPIKHIVIIFGENRSFDHYFGTYPNALNPRANRKFHPLRTRRP